MKFVTLSGLYISTSRFHPSQKVCRRRSRQHPSPGCAVSWSFVGYVYHFRSDLLDRLFGSRSIVVSSALLSVGFISLAGLLPQRSKFMLTVGITALYLGFGIVLMLSLRIRGILPNVLTEPFVKIGNVAASVGRYSYSIYLWHWPVRSWGFALFHKVFHRPLASIFGFAVYMSLSIFVGVLLARLVEYPVLTLRDRAFQHLEARLKYGSRPPPSPPHKKRSLQLGRWRGEPRAVRVRDRATDLSGRVSAQAFKEL
jgi:peptidoglycan/LPS O-acetylase OafA/YrhL